MTFRSTAASFLAALSCLSGACAGPELEELASVVGELSAVSAGAKPAAADFDNDGRTDVSLLGTDGT